MNTSQKVQELLNQVPVDFIKLEEVLSEHQGKKIVYDVSGLKGMSKEQWDYYAETLGITFLNTTPSKCTN